jgi:hypothetical protein
VDFSGIGMSLISCCFMVLIPPIPASIAFFAIDAIRKQQGLPLSRAQRSLLIAALYAIGLVASCLFVYLAFLKDMYVM